VAFEVAKALDAPLDVIVVRKLGVPFQPELAMGAIGEGGARVLDPQVISAARITSEDLAMVENKERERLGQRLDRYRRGRRRTDLHGRTAIVVDDGIATGSTARVACHVARELGAARVILAVPVAPPRSADSFREADDVVCLITPRDFQAVGSYYQDFSPTEDEEVVRLLDAARSRHRIRNHDAADEEANVEVEITAGQVQLRGSLHLPAGCEGAVLFAHGSGSSRHSPRNRFVASVLQDAGFGTLLMDLLTPSEEVNRANVFDISLLGQRLALATRWLRTRQHGWSGRIGYFGASTGAAAALWAAAEPQADIAAVVSRGGRPDLAGARLVTVQAPTLLIVGGADTQVLALNRQAMRQMRAPTRLEIVPGATHLFEEPGTLAQAADLAASWFSRYLFASRQGDYVGEMMR
jgi:putative phosphoribosyl transferase